MSRKKAVEIEIEAVEPKKPIKSLLDLIKPPLYKVMIPEWGDEAHIYLRSMTDAERTKHLDALEDRMSKDPGARDFENFMRETVIKFTRDEDGEQLLDEETITQVPFDGIATVFNALSRLMSGTHDYEAAKKR